MYQGQELTLCAAEWVCFLDKQAEVSNNGIPISWQSKKDQLLSKENEQVLISLTSNPNYLVVSQAVALLTGF